MSDNTFESNDGVFGRSLDGLTIEKGGEKKWFQVPKEYGGGKKNVIKKFNNCECYCNEHITELYCLEDNIIVFYCNKAKSFAWIKS